MTDASAERLLGGIILVSISLLLTVGLIAAVFMSGQTFGQRCAEVYDKDTLEWAQCIRRLSNGEDI